MNPVPPPLRHLEALFDHYNVDSKGHFLGESSSFYLSHKPLLPVLLPADSNSSASGAASAPSTEPSAPTAEPNHPSRPSPLRHASSSQASPPPEPYMGPGVPLADSAVHASATDGLDRSRIYRELRYPVMEPSIQMAMSQFPPPRLARELIVVYLSKINRFMPLVPTVFLDEYDAGVPQSPFLLLAIFAIASKYSSDPRCRSDPLRAQTAGEGYCKAACRLVDEFLDCPRLSTVQGLFLLGKHLEETKNQAMNTKSFIYIGMAIRMAMAMGLNRNCSGWGLEGSTQQGEYRNRTWWYLYVYDRMQGACYGRPFLIHDQDCGADKPKPDPLARNPDQDKVNVEHFVHLVHLSTLLGRVVNTFYPANTSGSNFYCNSKAGHGHAGDCAQVANMLAASGVDAAAAAAAAAASASAGSRKRTKTASRPKSKALDPLSAAAAVGLEGAAMSEANGSGTTTSTTTTTMTTTMPSTSTTTTTTTSSSTQGTMGSSRMSMGSPLQQDMLMRQYIANQKQDAIVAELDKELTEWVQALPPHLQWDTLQATHNVFGDILHGLYYVVLILLHRPSMRVGELMTTATVTRQGKCPLEADTMLRLEGCHSMSVCAQAASRITKLAERCQVLTHLERFGAGAYILLHAARVQLVLASIPTPPRQTGSGPGGCGPSVEFIEGVRKRDEAVDQFYRSLGSLRKFSVYHWTVDGISTSIRTMERILAAVLQEQEMDQEQELERQRQKIWHYGGGGGGGAGFFDHEGGGGAMHDTTPLGHSSSSFSFNAHRDKGGGGGSDENIAGGDKPEEEESLPLHERTYYESMRFLEMRLLYQERHRYSKDNHLEEHLQRQDSQPLMNPGMDLAPRRLEPPTPNRTEGPAASSRLFASTPAPPLAPNKPELVIKPYKPNMGKTRRRVPSSTIISATGAGTRTKANHTGQSSKASDGQARSLPGTALEEAIVLDDGLLLHDTTAEVEGSSLPEASMLSTSEGAIRSIPDLDLTMSMMRSASGPSSATTPSNTTTPASTPGPIPIATQARDLRGEMRVSTPQGSPSFMTGIMSTTWPLMGSEQERYDDASALQGFGDSGGGEGDGMTPTEPNLPFHLGQGQTHGGSSSASAVPTTTTTTAAAATGSHGTMMTTTPTTTMTPTMTDIMSDFGLEHVILGGSSSLSGQDNGLHQEMSAVFLSEQRFSQQQRQQQQPQPQQQQQHLPSQQTPFELQLPIQHRQQQQQQQHLSAQSGLSSALEAQQQQQQHLAQSGPRNQQMTFAGGMEQPRQGPMLVNSQASLEAAQRHQQHLMQQTTLFHGQHNSSLQHQHMVQLQRQALLFQQPALKVASQAQAQAQAQVFHPQDQFQPHVFMQAMNQ
ncbi:hypothetical protein BGX31_009322, partial [Mortierella sp. GBA43]